MSKDFSNYVRKQFAVSAAQITPLNIEELAKACGGAVVEGEKEGNLSRKLIRFKSTYGGHEKTLEAHVGDWLVRSGRNYRVYNDVAFHRTFDPQSKSVTPKNMPRKRPNNKKKPAEKPLPEGIELHGEMSGTITDSLVDKKS